MKNVLRVTIVVMVSVGISRLTATAADEKPALKLEPGKYTMSVVLNTDKEGAKQSTVQVKYEKDKLVITLLEVADEPAFVGEIDKDGNLTAQIVQGTGADAAVFKLTGKVTSPSSAKGTFEAVKNGEKQIEGTWELTKVQE